MYMGVSEGEAGSLLGHDVKRLYPLSLGEQLVCD